MKRTKRQAERLAPPSPLLANQHLWATAVTVASLNEPRGSDFCGTRDLSKRERKIPGFETQRRLRFHLKSPRGISRLSFLCGAGDRSEEPLGATSSIPFVPPAPYLLSFINKGQLAHLRQLEAAAAPVRSVQGTEKPAPRPPTRPTVPGTLLRPSRPGPHQAPSRCSWAAAWPPASSAELPYAHPARPHPTARRIQIRPLPPATRKARLLRPAPPPWKWGEGGGAASAPWLLGWTDAGCELGRMPASSSRRPAKGSRHPQQARIENQHTPC